MLMGPQNLALRLAEVRDRMARAAARAGRSAHSVTLLAVSKAQPLSLVTAAADLGLTDFGESYLDEALGKIAALQDRPLTWHFIGRVQANKTRPIAAGFAWVHARRPPARRRAPERAAPVPCTAPERVPAGEPRRRADQGRRRAAGAAGARARRRRPAAAQAARPHVPAAARGGPRAPAPLVRASCSGCRRASTRRVPRSTRSRWA